ncbi:MAG: hypothetical protein IJ736_14885 [Firmicutes bacterium]|nr:hypothetical protein [Bacillota bacterium]
MEELFVYALLYVTGYEEIDEYCRVLDRLFLNDPENEELLDLEWMDDKDAMFHLFYLMQTEPMNYDKFGTFLMNKLDLIYRKSKIDDFVEKMYRLWKNMPDTVSREEPFYTFCYADDCLYCGDEQQCRELCEKTLNYYKN